MSSLPHHIGKYRVVAHLGQGGMARVLLCITSGVGDFRKLMVVKQLREELASEPEFLTMFLDEARLAARLSHPNVVQTYEVGEDAGQYFIAMDYLEGQPLNRVVHRAHRDKMPLELHLRILAEVLSGLHYAHELRDYDGTALAVVHRDVSPHNVFVTYDGQVKLVDFGIAKAAGAANLTKEGEFKGKVNYIAPEQANADRVDRRADIFSVGVMLWEALTRRRIALGQSDLITLSMRLSGKDPPLAEHAPESDPALVVICQRAMAFLPDDRYATAEEFRDALEGYLADHSRAGTRQLASFMSEHFAEERARLRATVEAQVKVHANASSDAAPPILTISMMPASPRETMESAPVSGTPTHSPTATSATQRSAPIEVQPRSAMRAIVPVALAMTAVGLVAVYLTRGPGETTSAPSPAQASEAPSSSSAAQIQLDVTVEPASASITIDGGSAANPFRARVERDGTMHRIRATADGHEPAERVLAFDRDHTINIVLDPIAQATTASASASQRPRPVPKAPGVDPAVRAIDEKDPYK